MSDKDNNLNPDWRDDDEFANENDSPAEPAEEVPDWLAALGPNYVQPESVAGENASDEAFAWTAEVEDEDEAPQPEQADAGADFAWMSEIADEEDAPPPATQPEQADAGTSFAWTAQVDDDEGLPPAQANIAEDFPAWLQGGEEPADAAPLQNDSPDWLNDIKSEEEAAAESELPVAADIPDWLSDLQPPEATGAPVAAQASDEDETDAEFGWIDQMIQQEEAGETPNIAQPEATGQPADTGEMSWLPDFRDQQDEVAAQEAENAVELEMPDWLNTLAEAETSSQSEAADEVVEVETFEWASELEEAVSEAPAEADAPAAEPETFSWTNEYTATSEPLNVDAPEWLKDFEAEVESSAVAEEASVVTVQPGEQPEWVSEITPEEADPVFDVAPEEAAVAAMDEFDFEMTEAQDEALVTAEHRPATNAPDWLNAMVPGVDLDYTPESSDEAAEPEPELPVGERRNQRDFEWLVDIVDEETQPAPGPVVAHESETPRFSFSKLPAWLRGKQAAVGGKSDTMSDWPSDSSD